MRHIKKYKTISILALSTTLSLGCQSKSEQESAKTPQVFGQTRSALSFPPAEDCAQATNLSPTGPSLVFNDAAVLAANPGFALDVTLNSIISTSGSTTTTPADLMGSLLGTFLESSQVHPENGLDIPTDVRTAEGNANPGDFINAMAPVALFNRLDLAPNDGANCGEYRIIYALQPGQGFSGRFTLIFEARYPNPSPSEGLLGCQPIARYWAALENNTLSSADRAELLRKFFYEGVQVNKVKLAPVVQFENYRGELGQVRTNHFLSFSKWQLRDFRTANEAGECQFVSDTVKGTSIAELFQADANDIYTELRTDFQNRFVAEQLPLVLAPELNGMSDPADIIMSFGTGFGPEFYDFQADAQGSLDSPQAQASANFRQTINNGISVSGITTDHVLNRVGATTCGGCHQFSNNQEIAPGVNWPASLGFVHVDEQGQLSDALTDFFLPARRDFLSSQICAPTPWSLDVDGNGKYVLMEDGIALWRHIGGFGLLPGANIGKGAIRTSTQAIANYIDQGCDDGAMDIDGDGECTLMQDVLPAIWFLFQGSVPDHAASSIITADSTRTTIEEINTYVATLAPEIAWTLDIDADGSYDLWTDGLLLYKHFLELGGTAVAINVNFSSDAKRTNPAAIKAYIQEAFDANLIDIDGDGQTTLQGDILAVIWYLFNETIPPHVMNSLITTNSVRTTLPELFVYTELLKP